jgi:hypothetical protein
MTKYYDSIDTCPILVFIKINEGKKDFLSLCFEGKAKETEANAAWERLYSEYIQEFGISPEYVHYLQQKAQLCSYQKAFYCDNELWYYALIEVKKQEIEKLEAQMATQNTDFNEILGKLAKKMGFAINISKTTIREFYSYIKS